MIMKKILYTILLLVTSAMLSAQTPSSRYEQRYDLLVSQFGPAGVGVETVLNNWEKVDSTNARMLQGRFAYFFTKAQTGVVESRPGKKYLGMDPVITLKDSLGNDVNYFEINVFDDELYDAGAPGPAGGRPAGWRQRVACMVSDRHAQYQACLADGDDLHLPGHLEHHRHNPDDPADL